MPCRNLNDAYQLYWTLGPRTVINFDFPEQKGTSQERYVVGHTFKEKAYLIVFQKEQELEHSQRSHLKVNVSYSPSFFCSFWIVILQRKRESDGWGHTYSSLFLGWEDWSTLMVPPGLHMMVEVQLLKERRRNTGQTKVQHWIQYVCDITHIYQSL